MQKYSTTVIIAIKPIEVRKAININCLEGNDESSFVSNIIRKSVLLFTISNSKSNLFIFYMFNWVHMYLFAFCLDILPW